MSDWLTPEQRSRNMSSIRSRGNATTELAFVKGLRAVGIVGWRRHLPSLPGKPDFAFRTQKLAVFIDGCFWHGCPRCYRPPQDNRSYWRTKILQNRQRDRLRTVQLKRLGWRVLRIWEHSLKDARTRQRALASLFSLLAEPERAVPNPIRNHPARLRRRGVGN